MIIRVRPVPPQPPTFGLGLAIGVIVATVILHLVCLYGG